MGRAMTYSDEMLMAYVDRELDAATTASIDAAVARDPGLAARVERQRKLAQAVHAAYKPILEEPMPKRLLDAASGAAPAAAPARAPRRWAWFEWSAMAASLALGVAIGAVFIGEHGRGTTDGAADIIANQGQLLAQGALARALSDQLASTQKPDAPVRIGVTFVSKVGGYCRTFALGRSSAAGLACSSGTGWRIEVLAQAERSGKAPEYRAAAGSLAPAVQRAMEERIQGSSLDAAAERAAQQSGWRR
jgi:hypothetical protein